MDDPAGARVWELLRQRGRTLQWLVDKLSVDGKTYSIQRVHNWKTRRLPASAYQAVAHALGESVDWIVGQAPPKRLDISKMSPMAVKIAQEFDSLGDDAKQLETYTKIIGLIAIARGS